MEAGVGPAPGLSKREQSKLQRLIKSDEAHKNHAKSYKRKTVKGKRRQERAQRILINNQANDSENESANQVSDQGAQKKIAQEIEVLNRKKDLKLPKPFNPSCGIKQGEELFGYIMIYSYTEKEKKEEAPIEDPSFLDHFGGEALELLPNQKQRNEKMQINQQFQQGRENIQVPFDEAHKQLIRRILSFSE